MLVAGVVCLLIAAGLALVARSQAARLRQMSETETLTCGGIADLQKTAVEKGGPGRFARTCEVVGAAAVGEGGALRAPESGQEAVWHRVTVTEHYWDWDRDSDGDRRRVRRRREVADHSSTAAFAVDDGTGRIFVSPENADVDDPPKTSERFVQERGGAEVGEGAIAEVVEAISRWSDDTIGFEHTEWSIAPGTRLYVIGEVSDRAGRLELDKPEGGRFIVSTRTEEELKGSARRWSRVWAIAAGVLGVVGMALIVAGLLA